MVGVTTEQELAEALMDKERFIRLDAHIGLTGQFKSQQVGGAPSARGSRKAGTRGVVVVLSAVAVAGGIACWSICKGGCGKQWARTDSLHCRVRMQLGAAE